MERYMFFILFYFTSCSGNSQQLKTPKEFVNHVSVGTSRYSADSISILNDLYKIMKNHQASFNNSEYYDSTILIIDTIMYDASLNKIAVFVVAKNPVHRNPYSDSKFPFYYNANCYLGKRTQSGSVEFELKCLCRFSEINFDNYRTIIKALKEDFFLELVTVVDEKGQPVFEYNLNDKIFWSSPSGWRRAFHEN